jgi:RNA polymerase-binding transcription factor
MNQPASETTSPVPGGPRWRALLEARWRDRLDQVTELSVEFHAAAAAAPDAGARRPRPALQRLMQRATSARRALADTDEALARLSAGQFGRCENCGDPIPARALRAEPEARYCARCADPSLARPVRSLVTA